MLKIYSQHFGWFKGIIRTISNSILLFRTGRPYRIWDTRKVGGLDNAERFVLCPLVSFRQEIDFDLLKKFADNHGYMLEQIYPFGFAVLNPAHQEELIIAPGLILTQCSYSGRCTDIPDLSDIINELIDELNLRNCLHLT